MELFKSEYMNSKCPVQKLKISTNVRTVVRTREVILRMKAEVKYKTEPFFLNVLYYTKKIERCNQ